MKATFTTSAAAVCLVTLVTLVSGCGGAGTSRPSGAATPATATRSAVAGVGAPDSGAVTLTLSGQSFGAPITANPGEPIKVVNKDSVPRTVTSGTAFHVEVKARSTATFMAPTVPGTYPLTCRSAPKMHGTLIVRGI
jgi:plastocyanin